MCYEEIDKVYVFIVLVYWSGVHVFLFVITGSIQKLVERIILYFEWLVVESPFMYVILYESFENKVFAHGDHNGYTTLTRERANRDKDPSEQHLKGPACKN